MSLRIYFYDKFLKKIASNVELLQRKESFSIATIFDKTGSSPRTVGAKMVVRRDGSIVGTIGGGRLEASAIRLAMEALKILKQAVYHK